MKYLLDHDLHIHTVLSSCSRDENQTVSEILEYAALYNLSRVCITDHYWDETVPGASNWYKPQNTGHIKQSLPFPERDGIKMLFGCETDLDKNLKLGISEKRFDDFDFIIIPTTHLHMDNFTIDKDDIDSLEKRSRLWCTRFNAVLDMNLPFYKVGIAHLTCQLLAPKNHGDSLRVLSMIKNADLYYLFEKAASKGVGIELNFQFAAYTAEEREILFRIYDIAKKTGCKFYFGSDAHHPDALQTAKSNFECISHWLNLKEEDKFPFCR